ncbi:MAG TPA: carboxypeptidase-like regulatory domain-containing protein [Terriglobales bacterium]|nr:carboxypeptidase-like regulatory domain-containing protein [Terriglobales bacterium]
MRSVKSLFILSVLCLVTQFLMAQATNTGTVAGTVTDPSGAVVSGATVTLTDHATGTQRTTATNASGHYIFVDVGPGAYDLVISKQGFTTTKAPNLQVMVGQSTTFNTALQVGGATVEVEVNAAGAELQTMNATVGNTITSAALDALPSIGRDVSTFVELQPGVTPEGSVAGTVNDQTYFSLDGGNNTNDMDGNMSTYTATYAGDPTGGIAAQNTFYLTGNPTGVMPTPQDSVEEFKVNTAGQTVDFNNSSGAEVMVVTKRGKNAWHGTAYDYYLDNNWSSNSWQNNFSNTPLPSFHYNRFGFAIGGPAIPKEILGGKTYAFFNFEGFRWPDNSVTIDRNVPSPALKLGLITDPAGTVYNMNPTAVTFNGVTYPGNANCTGPCDPRGIGINPLVQQVWQKYEPASNSTCINSLCDGVNELGFAGNVRLPEKNNIAVARVDHDFGKSWHFMTSYRYFKFNTNGTQDQVDIGGFFPGDTLGVPASQSSDPQQAWYWVAGMTTNITPNTTNDFHYSYLRNWWQWNRAGDTVQIPGLGGALEIFSGESQVEDLAPYNVNTQQTRTRFWDGHDQMVRDDLAMLKGNHLFQFGGQYQHNFNWHQRTDNGGGINYQPVYQLGIGGSGSGFKTGGDVSICGPSSTIADCGALTAAVLGMVSIAQIAYTRSGPNLTLNPPLTPAFDKDTIPYYNVYFSDTWHMKKTFTLTYGLGWSLEMPPTEATGKQVVLVDAADQQIDTEAYLAARERAALAGQVYNPEVGFALVGNTANGLKYPYNPYYGQFSPRLAAAWNPHFDSDTVAGKILGSDDSVLRGGYGRQYGRLNGVDQVLVPLLGTGPIQAVQCLSNLSNDTCAPGGTATALTAFRVGIDGLNAPLPVPSQTLPQPDFPGVNAIAAGAGEALDPHFRPTAIDSFNLSLQRQISKKLTLELGYIGRRITHEYQPININAVPYMMTLGGQQFAQAYKNVVLEYCGGIAGLAGGGCAKNASAVAKQPFFEAAMQPSYCAGFSSCTAAVLANEGSNFAGQEVWALWSDLDSGVGCPTGVVGCATSDFVFPRSMMNTPVPNTQLCPGTTPELPCGLAGQLSSGVAMNASVGHGNYNGGFASVKMADWRGVTMQSNFTWSKALGTGAFVQATSGYTPDDPFNLNEMYGPQFYNRKFVYNTFIVYNPPFYKGQQGAMGRILGGWTFSTVFTAGSGQPNQVWNSGFASESFGEGDSATNYTSLETEIPIGPLPAHGHAYYNNPGANGIGTSGLPVSIFQNPVAAFNDYRNPILGLDTRDTTYLTGLPYWNLDFSMRKNIRITEQVALEFQGNFINVLNHNQWLDPIQAWGLFSPGTFGNLGGSAQETTGGNRTIQVGARVRF